MATKAEEYLVSVLKDIALKGEQEGGAWAAGTAEGALLQYQTRKMVNETEFNGGKDNK